MERMRSKRNQRTVRKRDKGENNVELPLTLDLVVPEVFLFSVHSPPSSLSICGKRTTWEKRNQREQITTNLKRHRQ